MRRADIARLSELLREPMRIFVREARARIALLVNASGQVLAQHGFAGRYHVMNVAALAAATNASAHALAEITGAGRWQYMHHAGRRWQLFLAPFVTPAETLILVTIFDEHSTLGLVELFFQKLAAQVRALPEFGEALPAVGAASFEHELEAGLDRVFAPDQQGGG
ncbi:MAG TPA: roadblock/LC7 domain-containing protein [Longimicrobiales bacterium]